MFDHDTGDYIDIRELDRHIDHKACVSRALSTLAALASRATPTKPTPLSSHARRAAPPPPPAPPAVGPARASYTLFPRRAELERLAATDREHDDSDDGGGGDAGDAGDGDARRAPAARRGRRGARGGRRQGQVKDAVKASGARSRRACARRRSRARTAAAAARAPDGGGGGARHAAARRRPDPAAVRVGLVGAVRRHGGETAEFSQLRRAQRLACHEGPVWVAKFDRDGAMLATAGQVRTFPLRRERSPSLIMLATARQDARVALWSLVADAAGGARARAASRPAADGSVDFDAAPRRGSRGATAATARTTTTRRRAGPRAAAPRAAARGAASPDARGGGAAAAAAGAGAGAPPAPPAAAAPVWACPPCSRRGRRACSSGTRPT